MNTEIPTPSKILASNRAWKARNKEKIKAYNALYEKTRDKEKKREQNRASAKRHGWYKGKYSDPIKVNARNRVRSDVHEGRMIKLPCEVCGNTKSQGHHEDYSKPLKVKWLCAKHHKEVHNVK